jgi:hypothetical protein
MLSRTRNGRRLWQGLLAVGLLSSLVSAAAADGPAAAPAPAAGIEAEVTGGLLTLHAEGAPLADVLRAIGEAGAFEVALRGAFAMPVRESFADRPLEDAIRGLVAGHSLVVRRDPAADAAALTEILVIENPAVAGSDHATPDARPEVAPDDAAETAQEDAAEELMDRAAFRLANQGVPPPTREDLLFDLDEPEPAARVAAVPKVGALPPREAIDVISHVFANDDDPVVRSRAVAALTRLDGPGARGLLRERALADDDPGLRMQALNALASSRGERAVNVIAQALHQDPEPAVRAAAVRALGRLGDWAQRYLEGAARDPDPAVSQAAAEALTRPGRMALGQRPIRP